MSMEMMASDASDDPIRKFQATIQATMSRAERLRPFVRACQDAIERAGVKASIGVGNRNQLRPKVEVMLFCGTLDETIPLFRELAKEGLKTNKDNTHKDHNLFEVIAMREYDLGPDVCVIAMLTGSKKEDGAPRCRMEQVGVKEVPVYEMKCD